MNKKKLMFVFVLMIFLVVPLVSAVKIDYSPNEKGIENMMAHIEDTILFGLINVGEQGTMELKSHNSPTEIKKVGLGNQVVMYYDTNFGKAQQGALGEVSFIDMRTGKEVEREWKFVYWGEKEYELPNYSCSNIDLLNGTIINECLEIGTKIETRETWIDYNSRDIPEGKIRIGLMANVEKDDYVDGIWEVQGKKIDRHASWSPSLESNLASWYSLNETSGVVVDRLNNDSGVLDGTPTRGVTGKINNSFEFNGVDEGVTDIQVIGYQSFSTGGWFYSDNLQSGDTIFDQRYSAGGNPIGGVVQTLNNGTGIVVYTRLRDNIGGGLTTLTYPLLLQNSTWYFFTATFDVSTGLQRFYINDGESANVTYTGGSFSDIDRGTIGYTYGTAKGNWFSGKIDEIFIYEGRILNPEEVSNLYNDGEGCTYQKCIVNAPTITLLSPADDFTSNNKSIVFIGNISDNTPLNVSLIINGQYNETNTSGVLGNYSFNKILEDGEYNWTFESCSVDGCANATERTLIIDTTPFIEFLTPPTLVNYANITEEIIPIGVNVSTYYFFNISYDLYNVNGTSFNQYYETETYEYNFTDIPDGHYHYNVTTCTTTGKCNTTETRNINHDVTPPEILIDSPTGESNYLYVGQPLELNFTAIDEIANVSECWWNYNGTNNSVSCTNGTLVSVPIAQEYGQTTGRVYSNDTFGNIGFNSTTWTYKILELNKTFSNETTEGAYEQFILYLNEGTSAMVQSVVLHYDGQTDTSSLFSSGDNVTAISELLIDGVAADINNTFYFTVTLTDSTTFNTTNETQLVRDISIDDCSSNPYPLLYLYLKDEEARTLLSGTIETNVEILNNFNYAQVLNISQEETGVSYVDLCSNVLLNETDFLINAEIRYNSENHSAEFYHIQRAALSNYPANISLFDLLSEDTTRFKVLYRNQDLIGVEGAVLQLQRKYISEGIYEVVEAPITSSESSGVLHIDTETNKYQITVVKNGEVLGLFQNLVFICESELTGECTLNLYDKLTPPNIVPLVDLQDFSSALETSIDNQTITLTYVVPSGTATSIQVLAIQKDTILGDSVICNQTVISSAGSIECAYATTIQDSKIDYKVFKSGELIAEKGYVVQEDLRDDWGGANYILLVVLLLSLAFMALSSPEWIVINAVITVLLGGGIWLIRGLGFVEGLGSIMWLVIGAVILISKLSKQEDY